MNIFKQLRKEKKITQNELAEILHVEQSTISKWELNKAIPDYSTLKNIAEYFNVSIDYLLGNETKTFTEEDFIKKPVTEERLDKALKQANLSREDINKLTPEQMNLLIGFVQQMTDKQKK